MRNPFVTVSVLTYEWMISSPYCRKFVFNIFPACELVFYINFWECCSGKIKNYKITLLYLFIMKKKAPRETQTLRAHWL